MSGKLKLINEAYAIAKIAGIKMCDSCTRQYRKSHDIDFRFIMPKNLYGLEDNYHPENSHVILVMIHRFYNAKINKLSKVTIWGTGDNISEFLYVDDMVRTCVHLLNLDKKTYYKQLLPGLSHINVGSGKELTIRELAETIKKVVDFNGEIYFDQTNQNGTSRKFLDSGRINNLGFMSKTCLEDGLIKINQDYIKISGLY